MLIFAVRLKGKATVPTHKTQRETIVKKNIKLYYASEENCFEGELIGKFDTMEEVIPSLRANLSEDIDCEKSIEENSAEIDSLIEDSEDCIEFTNCHGYDVVYIVTTDGREARSYFSQLRREMLG